MSSGSRWRRVCAAAIRLAALYAVGVTALLLLLALLLEGPPALWSDFAFLALPFGVLFLLAFLALASARRAGFAALWTLLVGLWTWMVVASWSLMDIPRLFLGWSTLALPLFAIGALGASGNRASQTTSVRVPRPLVVLTGWMVLAGGALYYADLALRMHLHFIDAPPHFATELSRFIWIPAPFAIAVVEVARMWLATARADSEAAAA